MVAEIQEAERNEILAAMQQMATEGKPVRAGDIVHTGDSGLDAQMVVGKIVEPGIVEIYDTRSGERSLTSRHMLGLQLTKTRADGSQVFDIAPPRDAKGKIIEPKRGKLKCWLHPKSPNRDLYDSWGLLTCTKENLPSLQQVKNHMRRRHKQEWEAIENERIERERNEDREMQRRNTEATMAALRAATGGKEGLEEVTQGRRRGRTSRGLSPAGALDE